MTKQIKTKQRVKDFGEVFTNEREVKAMCDLIDKETWDNIASTFLEPACGNGNFLVEIYRRKLERCQTEKDGLKALASIVGIDIQADNVQESRDRLKQMYCDKFPNANEIALQMADMILKNNIICGDSLKIMDKWRTKNERSRDKRQDYSCREGSNQRKHHACGGGLGSRRTIQR